MENKTPEPGSPSVHPVSALADTQNTSTPTSTSPKWSGMTKSIVGIILIIIAGYLVVRFHNYLNLLLFAMLLSLLLKPVIKFLHKTVRIKWGLAVLIVYLALASLIIGVLARGGTTIYSQIESLINNLRSDANLVSNLLEKLSNMEIVVGPFHFTTPSLSLQWLTDQITARIQPILGQAGGFAANAVGWIGNFLFRFFIVFMVSIFLSTGSGEVSNRKIAMNLSGYEEDVKRMGKEIANIFNSFVRGEFTIVGASMIIYSLWLGAMGVPYFFLCALIAGFGRFIPYIGAWLGWLSFIIASFLRTPPFGLTPLAYTAIIVIVAFIFDTLLDHWLTPKIMGQALEVHPVAIMFTALIGGQLFGIIGLVFAAPFFATVKLFITYIFNKLADRDPWEGISYYHPRKKPVYLKWFEVAANKVGTWFKTIWNKIKSGNQHNS